MSLSNLCQQKGFSNSFFVKKITNFIFCQVFFCSKKNNNYKDGVAAEENLV
jgi:hypothetical protein